MDFSQASPTKPKRPKSKKEGIRARMELQQPLEDIVGRGSFQAGVKSPDNQSKNGYSIFALSSPSGMLDSSAIKNLLSGGDSSGGGIKKFLTPQSKEVPPTSGLPNYSVTNNNQSAQKTNL
mmetsp:Transcript_3909/g.3324  ORF Transcript_3909/g.3324 Transcript_3909/m.3324 type:complete len:121 (+) Transcript_3909:315-677(+)